MRMVEIRHPPDRCDVCESKRIVCIERKKIFGVHVDPRLNDKQIWFCRDCRANVICHIGTNSPLGLMAGSDVRRLRKEVHELLDPVWKTGEINRQEAYNWLARQLSVDNKNFHIADLSYDDLKLAVEHCKRLSSKSVKEELRFGLTSEYTVGKRETSARNHRKGKLARRYWRR